MQFSHSIFASQVSRLDRDEKNESDTWQAKMLSLMEEGLALHYLQSFVGIGFVVLDLEKKFKKKLTSLHTDQGQTSRSGSKKSNLYARNQGPFLMNRYGIYYIQ